MNEAPSAALAAPDAAAPPPDLAAPVAVSPVPLTFFAPSLQKSLDPKSPLPVRGMAAKGLMPGSPRDILTALFVLSFDPEPKVSEQARATAAKVQDRLHTGLRDDELRPDVLAFYAQMLPGNAIYLEFIALNPATTDDTVAAIAAVGTDALIEVIAQNQLRLLRDERIVRAIVANPKTRPATKDSILDFCVRSGLILAGMPEYVEARRRILGNDEAAIAEFAEAERNTAENVLQAFGDALSSEGVLIEDAERSTLTQRILKMSIAQKIKLATLGNKEARTLLLRDSNKLVALAAVQSPRLTDGEVVALSNSRTLQEEVMRAITSNREWLKNYQVKVNLVNNPKCPVGVSLKLLGHLHPAELKAVARNKNIPSTLLMQARVAIQKKEQGSGK